MNKVWLIMILIAIAVGISQNQVIELNAIIGSIGKDTLTIVLPLIAMSCFFNGWLHVAKECGVIDGISTLMRPILHRLFPELKGQKETLGYIASNLVMNMFGLGSAATASGLKAMQSMQEVNPKKDTASRSMVTFIILNTAGITLFGSTVISLRATYLAANPADYLPFAFIASTCSCIFAVTVDYLINRLRA